ncbi:MAG: RNA 3'-terminal phosphate cyclase [Desulfurivibrionaceae bacterium]
MLDIDGSMGEGGGQVLRSSLTLAAITGKTFRMKNIRAGRSKPGLRPQHLRAVEAAAQICRAGVNGAEIGSGQLIFRPGQVAAGNYHFDIGTAGSSSLVLQTILLPLSSAGQKSRVTVTGGTHVPWSPCFEYLERHWCVFLDRLGIAAGLTLVQAGFYPKGGGCVRAEIYPMVGLKPLTLVERGRLLKIQGFSGSADLPDHIAERQRRRALDRLAENHQVSNIEISRMSAFSPGTVLFLLAEFENGQCCFFGLGERGKPAEQVADEAVDALEDFLATEAAIDHYLADQLLLPLALAEGTSRLSTSKITTHLLTNARVIRIFLPVEIKIRGNSGRPGVVEVYRS